MTNQEKTIADVLRVKVINHPRKAAMVTFKLANLGWPKPWIDWATNKSDVRPESDIIQVRVEENKIKDLLGE